MNLVSKQGRSRLVLAGVLACVVVGSACVPHPFDPAQAAQLLAEGGWSSSGDGTRVLAGKGR